MAHFLRSGNTYSVYPGNALDISETLPKGNYVLKFNPMQGFFLEEIESFRMPKKIYGDCLRQCERILNTFQQREGNTGVLLVGEKGSGKTLLARQISISSDMPTIVINTKFEGDSFNSFLGSITQPCIILLDEFEKTYDRDSQEKILTLLDGTYQSKKLFLLTSNDKWRLDDNMKNRPGRIYYLFEFKGIDEDFIRQYCADNLRDGSKLEGVLSVSRMFDVFNFDLLASIVEEINRYGEDPEDLVQILNAKPEYSGRQNYAITAKIGSIPIPASSLSQKECQLNTTVDSFDFNVYVAYRTDLPNLQEVESLVRANDTDWDLAHTMLTQGDIVFYDRSGRTNFPDDVEWESSYLECCVEPGHILQYTAGGGMVYQPDHHLQISLTKKARNRKRRSIGDIFS